MKNKTNGFIKLLLITYIFVFSLSNTAAAKNYPSPTDDFYVNDFANVLDSDTEAYISSMNSELEKATGAQVVIVTVSEIKDEALDDFSLELLRKWGIGDSKKNNGVLILLDVGGRQSRIEVGYGLEGALPDGKTGRIQDTFMLPYFKEGDYSTGIREGFNAVINEVYYEYGYDSPIKGDYNIPKDEVNKNSPIPKLILAIFVIALIILDFRFTGGMITFSILRGIGRGGGGGSSGGSGRSGGGGSGGGGGSSRGW